MATQVAVGTELNEVKLIRAGQRGDSQAVEALFCRYQRPLFQTALRVLGNAEDAEDELPASERFADDGPNPEQVYAGTELREMINANLDELSPLLRTAFVLREVQGYSTGEAAKKLGVTENTLKARLWRARHQMAERLGRRLKRMKDDMTGGMADPECSYC